MRDEILERSTAGEWRANDTEVLNGNGDTIAMCWCDEASSSYTISADQARANAALIANLHAATVAKPYDDYHEETGCVIWWRMPHDNRRYPYAGSPDCEDWPFEPDDEPRLYWTPLITPRNIPAK
jgi:hypothetical protein